MKRACLALSALLYLSACGRSEPLSPTGKVAASGPPRVVVAVADSAFNFYHSYFYAGSLIYPDSAPSSVTPEVLAEFGIPPENQIELTRSGDITRDLAADDNFWSRVVPGVPYWFKGTNLIGVSFCTAPAPLKPLPEKAAHGVSVSGAILKANPEVIVLAIEDSCAGTVPGTTNTAPEAHTLALSHPAVDLVSFSFGTLPPQTPPPSGRAYRSVVEYGKLLFQSAGNEPSATQTHSESGSWWTIGVSGLSLDNGQTIQAADFPDFVSAYEERESPWCMICETGLGRFAGTSHASPRAAGVASRVLLEARRMLGHSGGIISVNGRPTMVAAGGRTITNWDLRRVLEEAAYTDYGPDNYDTTLTGSADGVPINPVAPWLQLGWGDLTPAPEKRVVAEALAHLGLGVPTRFKTGGFCEFQTANMLFRQRYWGVLNPVPTPNPYVFCDSAVPRGG